MDKVAVVTWPPAAKRLLGVNMETYFIIGYVFRLTLLIQIKFYPLTINLQLIIQMLIKQVMTYTALLVISNLVTKQLLKNIWKVCTVHFLAMFAKEGFHKNVIWLPIRDFILANDRIHVHIVTNDLPKKETWTRIWKLTLKRNHTLVPLVGKSLH